MFWAATWGVGVAAGVGIGGWLTVTGGAGAPGAGSLDVTQDLAVIPAVVGGAVFVTHLLGQIVVSGIRSLRTSRYHNGKNEQAEHSVDERIEG